MKHCPACQSTFPDTQDFCTNDGTRLVSDESQPDLAKTMVAPPPSVPPVSSRDVPPTQVATNFPNYENQSQPPPPSYPPQTPPTYAPQPQQPSADYAPQSAQQWQQQPYAPQYQQQQQYAPPGFGSPRPNRKMLYIIIAAVVLIGGVVLLIVLLSGGGKSLGTYKGSLSDLTPAKVGSYEQKKVGSLEDAVGKGDAEDMKKRFGYDEARIAGYENAGKRIILVAANFSSPDAAKDGFQKLKQQLSGPGVTLKEEGKSKHGDGNRAVYALRNGPSSPEFTMVMWTNGSVGFLLGPASALHEGKDNDPSTPSSSDILDFEKNLSY